jgi:hypothetical protein
VIPTSLPDLREAWQGRAEGLMEMFDAARGAGHALPIAMRVASKPELSAGCRSIRGSPCRVDLPAWTKMPFTHKTQVAIIAT